MKNNNNIIIDYDLLYDKNIDKIEKDLKIFGTYEWIEIADIIEKYLVLNRYFSSYSLIKFSLLNILALTRLTYIESISNQKIVQYIFDFCEKTNFLVRKYIIIYLNIFQTIKIKELITDKKECDECLSTIIFNLNLTNMIPKEESGQECKDFNECGETIEPEMETPQPCQTQKLPKIYYNTPTGNDEDKDFNIFVEKGSFFEIKEGFFKQNTKKRFEEALKVIEVVFSGCFNSSSNSILEFNDKIINKLFEEIKNKDKKKSKKFMPKTPLGLYWSSNKLLNYFLNNYSIGIKIYDDLLMDLLSLIYYLKIPIINQKWIETIKNDKGSHVKQNNDILLNANKDKKEENNQEIKDIQKTIKVIISILTVITEKIIEKRNIENNLKIKIK